MEGSADFMALDLGGPGMTGTGESSEHMLQELVQGEVRPLLPLSFRVWY